MKSLSTVSDSFRDRTQNTGLNLQLSTSKQNKYIPNINNTEKTENLRVKVKLCEFDFQNPLARNFWGIKFLKRSFQG